MRGQGHFASCLLQEKLGEVKCVIDIMRTISITFFSNHLIRLQSFACRYKFLTNIWWREFLYRDLKPLPSLY